MTDNITTTESVPTVFVPNYYPNNDYESATSLGALVFMTKGIVLQNPDKLHKLFRDFFKDANENDILLFSASNLLCAVAYHEWCARFPESRFVATWDKYRGYTLHNVTEK